MRGDDLAMQWKAKMKSRKLTWAAVLTLFARVPTAMGSSTWYVDGVNGSDSNDCKSRQTACQTIGYAVGLASSDDSVLLARAIYTENLTINFNLRLAGSGATRSIIDGGGNARVVSILSTTAPDPAAIFRNSRRFTSNVDMDHSRCLW
jgi:hypothetical protein